MRSPQAWIMPSLLSALLVTLACLRAYGADGVSTRGFSTPIGIGSLIGDTAGELDYGLVIEGQNHFDQRRGMYGLRRYGEAQSRFELGNGVGVSVSAMTGVTLVGLDRSSDRFSPHLGFEPVNGRITVNSNSRHDNYYEWLPMASAGFQLGGGSCRFLPLVRGGGAAGNIASDGLAPRIAAAYGAGTYLNCANFDLSAEVTQISGLAQPIQLGVFDSAWNFRTLGLKIGLRGELTHASPSPSEKPSVPEERRLMLLLRSNLFGT